MSYRKLTQAGFTVVELAVAIIITGILAVVIYTIFNTSIYNYLGLQQDSFAFDSITKSSQRIANVFRGITDITVAEDDSISFYSYFSPNDDYVSFVRYYVAGDKPSLYAEITPMTANPPTGTQVTNRKRTYTIIDKFHKKPGLTTFQYLDSTGTTMPQPLSDLHVIKGITINLAISIDAPVNKDVKTNTVTVSLRNRKTNL